MIEPSFSMMMIVLYSTSEIESNLQGLTVQQIIKLFQMKYMMKSEVKSDIDTHSDNLEGKKIDWNDFNYPCCLRIFHYNSDETPEVLKRRVALLRVNHILILFVTLWNFINNIVDTAQGVQQGGIRIAISIFLILVWLPASFYIFITPYLIYMKEEAKVCVFYTLSFISIIWFLIWSIADFADANGWVMVGKNAAAGRGAAAFFGVVTSIFMMAISVLSAVNLYLFCRREKE